MRKTLSVLIAIGILSSAFVGCGTSTQELKNKANPNTASSDKASNKEVNDNSKNTDEDKKEDGLDIFLKGGVLEGNINENIGVVINLNNASKKDDSVIATEYYTKYPDESLDIQIKSDGNNNYTINESENGKATGIYKVSVEGEKLKGTFTNTSTNVKSNVNLEFKSKKSEEGSSSKSNVENKNKNNEDTHSNKSENSSNETIGFLRKVAEDKILTNGGKIVSISKKQQEEFQKDFKNNDFGFIDQFNNDYVLYAGFESEEKYQNSGRFYISTVPNDVKLVAPNYIINGEPAWSVSLQPASVAFGGGKMSGFAIIGANGKVYNNKDLYDAAEKGEFKRRDYNTNELQVVPVGELSYNYYHSPCGGTVIWANGSSMGMMTSKDNPDPQGWKPPESDWTPGK